MGRRRSGNQVVTIYWRDIPTHINAVLDGEKHQFPLPKRFETAVDRAATKAGLTEASDYIGEVRRGSRPATTDAVAEAEEQLAQIQEKFTLEMLNRYVDNEGLAPDDLPGAGLT